MSIAADTPVADTPADLLPEVDIRAAAVTLRADIPLRSKE
jgi:hypothetical protein